ncbi:glycerol-3-phosphate transporter [Avibacterium gallinarum]|uniref:Glycerol-3-phosphate transporter n=1 Tax=Avibacterium gallinarum TaxID=755 RepID=A0A379AZC6_AVIGA|nr:phosphoglycerate transporter protein PgtP [Avibacterium gallinarum]POY44193.1 glycerol-3-phosphate transporter [Avibacterium gallinarum]TDP29279.1 OPA family glycerol-3-phosphate transporter-like MFS transporter [Avibacterium gallinarum]SUB28180.1 glycerol-3-phosphate transporter [Avibacterium gallinarum]
MFGFLKASPPAPRITDKATIDRDYRRLRWQVFFGVFIGYAAYYLIRKNFSLAIPHLIEEYGYTKAQLGTVSFALAIAYGFSKFIMGNVSDRSNPKYFITIGLVASAMVSMIFGLVPGVLSSLSAMIVLSALNGWFQGMGYPPGAKTMTNWFSTSERGSWWSWWNVSHNLGGGLIGPLAILGLYLFGAWQALFYLPATIAILLSILMFFLMRDTPESQGLPPIEEYKEGKVQQIESAHTLTGKEIFFKYIINNKFLWAITIANVFVYFIRYGIIDWAPTYLKEVKHFTFDKQSWAYFLYEYAGIFGMLASGYLSDKVFKGHRAPPMLMFLTGVLIAIFVYWKNPAGNPMVDNICLIAIGFLIYGPVMMIGLQAADLVPRVATGTATGLTGLFGYLLGSASAGTVLGAVVDNFGWDGGFYILIASSILAFIFISFTLFRKVER